MPASLLNQAENSILARASRSTRRADVACGNSACIVVSSRGAGVGSGCTAGILLAGISAAIVKHCRA